MSATFLTSNKFCIKKIGIPMAVSINKLHTNKDKFIEYDNPHFGLRILILVHKLAD